MTTPLILYKTDWDETDYTITLNETVGSAEDLSVWTPTDSASNITLAENLITMQGNDSFGANVVGNTAAFDFSGANDFVELEFKYSAFGAGNQFGIFLSEDNVHALTGDHQHGWYAFGTQIFLFNGTSTILHGTGTFANDTWYTLRFYPFQAGLSIWYKATGGANFTYMREVAPDTSPAADWVWSDLFVEIHMVEATSTPTLSIRNVKLGQVTETAVAAGGGGGSMF